MQINVIVNEHFGQPAITFTTLYRSSQGSILLPQATTTSMDQSSEEALNEVANNCTKGQGEKRGQRGRRGGENQERATWREPPHTHTCMHPDAQGHMEMHTSSEMCKYTHMHADARGHLDVQTHTVASTW